MGESLFPNARMAGPSKVTKNALPLHPALRFAPGALLASLALRASLRLLLRYAPFHYAAAPRVAVQGPSMALYGGTPSSLAASLRLAPLRDGSVHPPEGAFGVVW